MMRRGQPMEFELAPTSSMSKLESPEGLASGLAASRVQQEHLCRVLAVRRSGSLCRRETGIGSLRISRERGDASLDETQLSVVVEPPLHHCAHNLGSNHHCAQQR